MFTTTNLGTKFNVSAFTNEETIVVSLEEGKVEVATNKSGTKKEDVILAPAQQLIYNKEKKQAN